VLGEEEGLHIAESLGNKKVSKPHKPSPRAIVHSRYDIQAAILKNHGVLVATSSIEATIYFFKLLQQVCHVQLMSDALANGKPPTVSGMLCFIVTMIRSNLTFVLFS
jgi:ribulose-5-phosphate 4-epimerase/fuculose-1-phosphate aldolase